MTKYRLSRLIAASAALLTLALCCMPQGVQGQETYYTLTNGRLWWYEGGNGVGHKTEVAFDKNNRWAEVHRYDASNVTLVTDMGAVYMALDTTTNPPSLVPVDTANFNPLCAWQRTGTTGYYYQVWGDYRYYVLGTPMGISIAKIKIGDPIDNVSYWYNWDFGAAINEITYRDGVRKESYHWIIYDSEQANPPVWRISNDSYQRPEDAIYDRKCTQTVPGSDPARDTTVGCAITSTGHPEADSVADARWKYYYDNYEKTLDGGASQNVPAGNGALYLPVRVTGHQKEIAEILPEKGLVNVTLTLNEGGTATKLRYGQSATATPVTDLTPVGGGSGVYQAQVTQPYIEYRQEIYRYGIHTQYGQRETETFGSAGIPSYRYYYYYSDNPSNPAVGYTRHTVPPTSYGEDLQISKVTYTLNNSSRRYLSLNISESNTADDVIINCVSVPPANAQAKLTVTVTYTNGTSESKTIDIPMSNYVDLQPMPLAVNAPVINGYLVGGGRMANVGGNTSITVHACDSIYAIYGGNDIAGWVQGDNGSTLQLGTEKTDVDHQIHIGYAYGGGCGYYTYRGINFGVKINGTDTSYIYPYDYGNTSLIYQCYYFNGEVYPWGYEPRERTAPLHGTACNALDYNNITPADTACLHWNWERDHVGEDPDADGVDRRVVDKQFVFDPLYLDPNDVDNNETGDNGNGTVPYIKKSHITVGVAGHDASNDYIRIDTLFGGAENAFIGVQTDGSVAHLDASNIIVNGGTIYAIFGGNNYGGSIAHTATTNIFVRNTKLAPKPGDAGYDAFKTSFDAATGLDYTGYGLENTYFRGYGRDYGIRYVYGGGNLVESEFANVTITGGMIDTCFLGGNRATVDRPVGTIYCTDGNFIYENDSVTREWVWKANGSYEGVSHVAGQVVKHPEPWTLGDLVQLSDHRKMYDDNETNPWRWYDSLQYHSPGRFRLDIGRYNVRVLFGGNNNAPMYDISRILLASGGVGSIYGGGNAGDMRSMRPISDVEDMATRTGYAMDGWLYQWPEVFSTFVHSPGPNIAMESNLAVNGEKSRIICECLYGGCRKANVKGSTGVWLSGGVFGYVNGGNDISGDVGTETGEGSYVVLDGDVVVMADVYGGSDGYYHCHKVYDEDGHHGTRYMDGGDTLVDYNGVPYDPYDEFVDELVPTQNSANLYIHANWPGSEPKVLYSAYGGGVMTNVGYEESRNNRILLRDSIGFTGTGANGLVYENGERELRLPGGSAGNKRGSVHFQMNGGTVGSEMHHGDGYGDGNAYGGGYLSSIYGLSYTYIMGTSTIKGSLYAGNDCMGSIANFGAYSIPEVHNPYVSGNPLVHQGWDYDEFAASDGYALNEFDGSSWNAAYSAYLRIEGTPHISCVYGSGNGAYDYDGTRPEYSSGEPVCQQEATENRPLQASTFIDLNLSDGAWIDTVFGGGNGVGVRDNVTVLLYCDNASVHGVGTIFGGNNRDDMNQCVPDIVMKRGTVDNVFGGGNAGNMNGRQQYTDACGNLVDSVSAYVQVNEDQVTVTNNIFGGCRKADVKYKAYIDIRSSHASGINNVYGGNDISGTVKGGTRIDVSGGVVKHIWGGSNGHYDYERIASNDYTVFPYDSDHSDTLAKGTSGIPFVDKTVVNLWGGTIEDHVYGGGRLGDCRLTNVIVNDQACPTELPAASLTIMGSVYGGGEGIWENLDKTHRGNVVSTTDGEGHTNVELHHASSLTTARAYGGGRGGDVENTYIEAFDTWDQPFDAIYGGCWGSTVFGSTNVTMRGNTSGSSMTADSVFGGNDFTGYVHQSNVNIYNGRYGNIYGAGNGNYADALYRSNGYSGTFPNGDSKRLYPPNTFRTSVNFEDGYVENNIYGGGMLGTCIPYVTNAQLELVPDVNGRYVADTNRTLTDSENLPHTDVNKYSRTVVNIKGGTVNNSVYAGAAGKANGGALVYGVKELNMSGGIITHDLYGGSENVSDGYYHECVSTSNTTRRPSSIINISGGNVKVNVYGGGYLGNVYGSGYINIGIDAIDSCEIWTETINGTPNAYASFKPGANHIAPAMTTSEIKIEGSVYGGANWGENSGNADYTVPGFFGGKNRIIIDGEGYNTYLDAAHATLPLMDIANDVIGSGTSAGGGDIQSRIDIRNYGALGNQCIPTKTLLSIQRASSLWLHNTAIHFVGNNDATSAYVSRMFTINNVDTMNTMGYNVISLEKTATNIKRVDFWKEGWPLQHTDKSEIQRCWAVDHCAACNDLATVCDQLGVLNRNADAGRLPAFVLHQGINVDFVDENDHYSHLYGFAFLVAAPGTNAVVTAAPKYGGVNNGDGGFMSACSDSLKVILAQSGAQGSVLTWGASDHPLTDHTTEYPYFNYSTTYRVWSIGEGLRTRFAVVQAHSDPTKLAEKCRTFTKNYPEPSGTSKEWGLARATLKLPPTTPGNYYKINGGIGVVIDDENEEMRLTGEGFEPNTAWDAVDYGGRWVGDPTRAATMVLDNPGTYFGLVMSSGANFKRDASNHVVPPVTATSGWDSCTTIAGNEHVNSWSSFSSAQVGADVNALPELDLYMIYGKNFNHTLIGTVTFTLDEYRSVQVREQYDGVNESTNKGALTTADAWNAAHAAAIDAGTVQRLAGDYIDSNLNIPIRAQITISTILNDFKDMEYNVLAMYNEGRNNIFSRKMVLPATLERRELYLEKIEWAPTDRTEGPGGHEGNGNWITTAQSTPDYFYLTCDSASIINAAEGVHNLFRMTIQPSENVTNTMANGLGWHSRDIQSPLDLVKAVNLCDMVEDPYSPGTPQMTSDGDYIAYDDPSHTSGHQGVTLPGYGRRIGILDGHGEAALNVNLNFDGNRMYDEVPGLGYVGKVVLTLRSYTGAPGDPEAVVHDPFKITIDVKTRSIGDTIYVASTRHIPERGGITLPEGHTLSYYTNGDSAGHALCTTDAELRRIAGKSPSKYLTSIKDAFDERIYQEGDVICILDQVNVTAGEPLLIKGFDYMRVPVVRYDGHHGDFPGEACVYRGTMINVAEPNASFSARFITFNGGLLAKNKPNQTTGYEDSGVTLDGDGKPIAWADHPVVYNPIVPGDNDPGYLKFADTNMAFGPVIAVSNGATVALQNGVIVEQNYNCYTGSAVAGWAEANDNKKYGAINVTNGGRLTMINGVTVQYNLSDTIADPNDVDWRLHPYNGAVYLDGGTIELLNSNAITSMDITKNYVGGKIGGVDNTDRFWKDFSNTYTISGTPTVKLLRYDFDTSAAEKTPANVFLARQPDNSAGADPDLDDSQSEVIIFSTTIPKNTHIGITKWFPDVDEEKRDTIQIVYQSAGSHLEEAVRNNNFLSDNGFFVMYNQGVDVQRIFLQRCATFKHQTASTTPLIDHILPMDVLEYKCLSNVNCPAGGDSIIYRVQGGFFPYTYSWTGDNTRDHTTEFTSNEIKRQVEVNNFNGYRAAIADTLVTSNMSLSTLEKKKNYTFNVQATDASGNCHLYKVINLTVAKDIADNPTRFDETMYDGVTIDPAGTYAWNDTTRTTPAKATRNYKAVQIRPRVWANPYSGTIEALVIDNDHYKIFLEDALTGNHRLDDVYFCEGEVINLTTLPRYDAGDNPMGQFVMWDFDPYYSPSAVYVVPAENRDVVAYYSPMTHWKDYINTTAKAGAVYDDTYTYTGRPTVAGYTSTDGSSKAGYVTTYNGDVHIYDENGLAWFISVVNGLNGTQAREFFFNKVYLHQKSGGYDMKDYLWSPVGNRQHAFRGWFQGVAGGAGHEADTACLAEGEYVDIMNIILNEPEMDYVGMFGFLDSARVYSVRLQGVMARGNQNVGAVAASSVHTHVKNCVVMGNTEGEAVNNTTILATHYVSGGMLGLSDHDRVTGSAVSAKYIGDAVYSGGVIGHGTSTRVSNTGPVRNDSRMSGLYVGGLAGWLDGSAPVNPRLFRKGKSGDMSELVNNYVQLVGDHKSQREGGLVGHSSNTRIENNYVYGKVQGTTADGAVAAVLDNGSRATNNYYEYGAAKHISGNTTSTATVANTASFEGRGNRVKIDQQVYGVNNLTRVLNIWVKERNAAEGSAVYKTWRSDLQSTNSGYPIYGQPDLIPVESQVTVENCDTVEWEGNYYTVDTNLSYNIVDSVLMIDSTTALTVIVHHSTSTSLNDSIGEGDGYANYGFYLTPAETMLMHSTLEDHGSVTIVLSDTLTTAFGCDSVITLNLTISRSQGITEVTPVSEIKVYPNPTTSYVTVEATELKHVELYDNEGRRLADYVDAAANKLTFDVDRLSSGVYFLRIHTGEKVTIQKLIKR